jgi:trigger factor
MKFNIETHSENSKIIKIEIPLERVHSEFEKLYSELTRNAVIPGFRKGKIPRSVLKLRMGEDIAQQVGYDLVRESLPEALKSIDDVVIGMPEIAEWTIDEDKPFQFEAEIEILPPVDLKAYKGIEVPRIPLNISDKDIQESLERIREGQATFEVVQDRPVENNDRIYGRITLTQDDKPVPGWTNRHLDVEIGKNTFFPDSDMENRMIGARINEDHTFSVEFPDDYSYYKDFAGKSVSVLLKINDIKTKRIPEINDELARDMGLENREELVKTVRDDLENRRNHEIDEAFETALFEEIISKNTIPAPDSLVENEAESFIENYFHYQKSLDDENKTKLLESIKPLAAKRVQRRLILDRIAEMEKIETTDDELENAFKEIAEQQKKDSETVRREWEEENAVGNLKRELARNKALTWLKQNVVAVDAPEASGAGDDQDNQTDVSVSKE